MGLISRVSSRTYRSKNSKNGTTQVFEDQESPGQGAKAEPTFATVVPVQDQQQNPVQRQATTLEANQARFVNSQAKVCDTHGASTFLCIFCFVIHLPFCQ